MSEKKTKAAGRIPSLPPGGQPRRGKMDPRQKRHPMAIRRKAVQLATQEGISPTIVARELGVDDSSVKRWVRNYRDNGEAGLQDRTTAPRQGGLPKAVVSKIVELKTAEPSHGARKISDMLRRLFFMRASPTAVGKHTKAHGLITPPKKKRRVQTLEDRRYEYSKPNAFWQSDITVFTLHDKPAFIIGFIDDHSRYITGIGLYRGQCAENVLEVYRRATGEHGVPAELLTDNGRQYANWRGKTKFQKVLARDHVHHIRSQPHHPQTLGKIERFWQTLKGEFLSRSRFETFDEAQERLAYWVKHYNHRRPHQSLEGLCPADRFFKIREQMKAAIEKNMTANMEELALHGKPIEPFYMVGQVGDRSLVIESDKKRISVRVNGSEIHSSSICSEGAVKNETGSNDGIGGRAEAEAAAAVRGKGEKPGSTEPVEREEKRIGPDEGTFSAVGSVARMGTAGNPGNPHGIGSGLEADKGGSLEPAIKGGEADRADSSEGGNAGSTDELKGMEHAEGGTGQVRGGGEVPGGTGDLDRTEESISVMPGTGNRIEPVVAVAGSCAIGYVGGIGAEGEGRQGGTCACPADKASAGQEDPGKGTGNGGSPAQKASDTELTCGGPCDLLTKEVIELGNGTESAGMAESHSGCSGRPPECYGGSRADGSQPQDVLREAGAGLDGDAGGAEGPADWETRQSGGSGEGGAAGGPGERQKGAGTALEQAEDTGGDEESPAGVGSTSANG